MDPTSVSMLLRRLLPKRWFPDTTPVLDGVLAGVSSTWVTLWANLAFVQAALRLATAPGEWLDMAAQEFLGGLIGRKPGQGDAAFSVRVRREIVRQRATRAGLLQALVDLTGRAPRVFEPARPTDTGGYGQVGMVVGTGFARSGGGTAGAGGYGSLALPFQCFVTAYRAIGGGIAGVMGYYQPGAALYAGTLTMAGMGAAADNTATVPSSDVSPPAVGYAVVKHVRGLSQADTNVGYVSLAGAVSPLASVASAQVYLPALWPGQSVTLRVEGSGWSGYAYADTTVRGQWQTVSVPIVAAPGAVSNPYLVLRVYGPAGTVVYSCAWQAGTQPYAGGGYGAGAIEYGQLVMSQGQITDADINAQVAAVMPAATIAWTAITN